MSSQDIPEIEVKPGMELLLTQGADYERIVTVEHVTPTGRITLKGFTNKFDKNGREISPDSQWYKSYLSILDDENREQIQRKVQHKEWVKTLSNIKWEKLNNKTLGDVITALSFNGVIEG